jgi:hypothetical protein
LETCCAACAAALCCCCLCDMINWLISIHIIDSHNNSKLFL